MKYGAMAIDEHEIVQNFEVFPDKGRGTERNSFFSLSEGRVNIVSGGERERAKANNEREKSWALRKADTFKWVRSRQCGFNVLIHATTKQKCTVSEN